LALTYTVLTLLVMAGLWWAIASSVRDFLLQQIEGDLLRETALAADLIEPALAPDHAPEKVEAVAAQVGDALDARVTVIAPDGVVLADTEEDPALMENHAGRPEVQQAQRTGSGIAIRPSATLHAPYLYVARLISGGVVVRLSLPLGVVDALLQGMQRHLALAALFAAALMTGAGWFVAERIRAGLDPLRAQAAAIAAGQLDVTVEPANTRELGDLGRSFNTMAGNLRQTLTELEGVRVRLEATLANLQDGVIITDAAGQIVLANDAARAMLGVDGAIAGMPIVIAARDHELAGMVAEALTGDAGPHEGLLRHGTSGRMLQTVAQRLDAAGERIALVVLRDVTTLRQLEELRRQFVANVSHELRTPLASIRALAETLEAGAIDDAEVARDFVARIVAEVDQLTRMVDELLDLARLESGKLPLALEPIAPRDLLERAARRMAPRTERDGLTVEVEAAGVVPLVLADRARIDQVLLNLLDNAVKYTPSGGVIALSAAPVGRMVEFRVRDSGPGVGQDDLPRLFERFYKVDRSRGSEGTGLGLAIARHIVEAHGGRIRAESALGQGAVFIFTLPMAASGKGARG
jgi:two-component system phosphate regulon sensor histidine kinase PhoR